MPITDSELPDCLVFNGLSPEERRELLSRMQARTFEPGETIIHEGQTTPGLWIVSRGTCEVLKAAPGGQHVLAELGPGTVFGEMSFFERAPHAATVRSVSAGSALLLTPEQYRELQDVSLTVAHRLAQSIAAILAERLRKMDEWISPLLAESRPEKHQEWADFRAKLYNGWMF